MKKILYVGDLGSKHRTGGGYTFARNLLQILDADPDLQVHVICYQAPRDQGTVIETICDLNLRKSSVHIMDLFDHGIGKPWVDLQALLKTWRLVRTEKYSLAIFDQPNFFIFRLKKIPIICMFHGKSNFWDNKYSWRHARSSLVQLWQRITLLGLYRRLLQCHERYVSLFNSMDTLNKLVDEFATHSKKKSLAQFVVGLPVDTHLFRPDQLLRAQWRAKHGIGEQEIVILYLSNFVCYKKRAFLAPKILLDFVNRPNIRLVFVGAGDIQNASELERFCTTATNAIRVYEVAPNSVVGWMNMADINISFSNYETFGYSVVEGMSCGLSTVVFGYAALINQITHMETGLVVQSDEEFINALEVLVHDRELRSRLGASARDSIVERYSYAAWHKKLCAVMQIAQKQ